MLLCQHSKDTPNGNEHLHNGRESLVLFLEEGVTTCLSLALEEEVNPDRHPTSIGLLKLRKRCIAMLASRREDTAAYAVLLMPH